MVHQFLFGRKSTASVVEHAAKYLSRVTAGCASKRNHFGTSIVARGCLNAGARRMFELINLVALTLAMVGVVLGFGARDRISSLEFRLGGFERRLREGAVGVAPEAPPAAEPPPEPAAPEVIEPIAPAEATPP